MHYLEQLSLQAEYLSLKSKDIFNSSILCYSVEIFIIWAIIVPLMVTFDIILTVKSSMSPCIQNNNISLICGINFEARIMFILRLFYVSLTGG